MRNLPTCFALIREGLPLTDQEYEAVRERIKIIGSSHGVDLPTFEAYVRQQRNRRLWANAVPLIYFACFLAALYFLYEVAS